MEKYCPSCEDYRAVLVVKRAETYRYRGEMVTVPVTRGTCVRCGGVIGTDEEDQAIMDAVRKRGDTDGRD